VAIFLLFRLADLAERLFDDAGTFLLQSHQLVPIKVTEGGTFGSFGQAGRDVSFGPSRVNASRGPSLGNTVHGWLKNAWSTL